MSNIIEINNLSKIYSKSKNNPANQALGNVDIAIKKGAIYGLLGPNGAGKSTLINILAGLTIKTSGDVIVNDINLDKNPRDVRMSLGVVPQEVVLDPFFSVYEMLEYHAGYYGVEKKDRRTDEILQALSLTDKATSNSRRLSGGMKRRVLIAKALVHNPPILILDEPTAGVDVELRSSMWKYVRELNDKGTTILLTTHYLEEAEELCNHIAIINHGKVVVEDTTSNLINKLDHKQLTLKLHEEIAEIPKIFSDNGLDVSITKPNILTINYHCKEVSVGQLLDFTNQANLTIKDISTQEADLEDIFRLYVNA